MAADPGLEGPQQEVAECDPEDSGPAASRWGVKWGVPYKVRGPGLAGESGMAWESDMNPCLAPSQRPAEREGQDRAVALSMAVNCRRLKARRRRLERQDQVPKAQVLGKLRT